MADVLIVDDEPDIRTLLGDILTDEDHNCRMAETADGALARSPNGAGSDRARHLAAGQPDGRHRGVETVKRDDPDLPVLIISGHGNIEVAVAAIKQGAYDFIEKALQARPSARRGQPRAWRPRGCGGRSPICARASGATSS